MTPCACGDRLYQLRCGHPETSGASGSTTGYGRTPDVAAWRRYRTSASRCCAVPEMDFPDLLALVVWATTRGVTKAFDNTWSAGAALMGSVPLRGEALHLRLEIMRKQLGTDHS